MKGSETMSTSMTKGNPLKLMLQFAFPLLIGNLLQQTYNIIDAAIVGQILGAKALASVGASSSVQFLVLGFCMGSCTGFSVPVAKYFGAGKLDKMRDYIFNGAALAVLIAAILTTLCSLLCAPILHLLSVPSDIFADAYAYQLVIFLGIPFSILYNYLSSILRAVGDSRTPFLFLAFSAILNIFLDLFCIIILHLGCAGAAIATISAQAINQRSTQMKKTPISENPAFTFRTFLLRLGLIGEEYKNVRKHLLANLEGDLAWRYDKSTYECLKKKQRTEDVRSR